ncbi:MAG: glycosyltransferase family 39 protein [Thermodesulfovibrionia bacterium]|nr:glycosyltransferase family 39 protein [Thermodesulfovibrionia bacterium]
MHIKKFIDHVTKSKSRTIIFLFLISLIIRLLFLIPFYIYDIPLITDENEYMDRAIGYEHILSDLSDSHSPSPEMRQRAYGYGNWPPLHPFLLGLMAFIFGKHIIVTRLLMVVLSAITTSIIYLIASRLVTTKAALAAALIHMFYVSYIAFSHYILSETTYIFFLMSSVYFALLLYDKQKQKNAVWYAVFSGLFLGLCGITRPAVLPFLFIIPFWLIIFLKGRKRKILLTSVFVISYLTILVPWQTYLIKKEQSPGILTNITGWYAHIGNNPWIPDGYGSSWQHDSRGPMVEAAQEYSSAHPGTEFDQAQRILASEEIKKDFKAFIIRGIYKLRMFWSVDIFVLIRLFYAAYPPIPQAAAAFILCITLISYIVILLLAVYGLLAKSSEFSKKNLILLMVLGGMAPSFVAFGVSRFNLPLFALLLPFAGYGAVNIKQSLSLPRKTAMALITTLVLVAVLTSFPLVLGVYLKPSSHYCGLILKIDNMLGTSTDCVDKVIFRASEPLQPYAINIETDSEGYSFNLTQNDMWTRVPGIHNYKWDISSENRMLRLDIYANHTSAPLEMKIYQEKPEQSVIIYPITMGAWRKWQPSGLKGVEYMWLGGGMGVRNKLPDDKLFSFE